MKKNEIFNFDLLTDIACKRRQTEDVLGITDLKTDLRRLINVQLQRVADGLEMTITPAVLSEAKFLVNQKLFGKADFVALALNDEHLFEDAPRPRRTEARAAPPAQVRELFDPLA